MDECVGNACAQAGLAAPDVVFEAACLGFSGGIEDKEAYSREFIRSAAFKITHDAEIALTGATCGLPGIIVIAGTGSIAFGKNAQGKTGRAGGWGYVFGDEGGGFDLVRQALRAALAMEEGWSPQTALHALLLTATGSSSANALMHDWYHDMNRSEIARLAPMVDGAARSGDKIAIGILVQAGRQLAQLVDHVHGLLFQSGEKLSVSYIGGVFESVPLTEAMRQSVQERIHCEASPPQLPPAAGALLEALRMAKLNVQLSEVPAIKR
jgi:N-acetylglucosamine kinase-like BadF-type ATPase